MVVVVVVVVVLVLVLVMMVVTKYIVVVVVVVSVVVVVVVVVVTVAFTRDRYFYPNAIRHALGARSARLGSSFYSQTDAKRVIFAWPQRTRQKRTHIFCGEKKTAP